MNRLDDLNRTERYFTSTLLGGLLLYNELDGTRQLLNWLRQHKEFNFTSTKGEDVVKWQETEKLPEHIEVVTELNIKREIGHYGETLAEIDLAELSSKQNVPDVVIVYGKYLIVIEGKFFVKGQSQFMIETQLQMQKEEIVVMVDYLKPQIEYVCHIFLGPQNMEGMQNCELCLTWKDIEEFSAELLGQDHYITIRLKNANQRYAECNVSFSGERINYSSSCSYDQIKELCGQEGNKIRVGFQGGEKALIVADHYHLLVRKFKWDYTENSIGKKNLKNWLPGSLFLTRLEEIERTRSPRPDRIQSMPQEQSRRNYSGKTDLHGIISLIAEHGDDLFIGFTGGINALRNTPRTKLENRPFKYDFAKNSVGKKNRSNWLRGSEFMMVLKEK
jgi:hypothetical protein